MMFSGRVLVYCAVIIFYTSVLTCQAQDNKYYKKSIETYEVPDVTLLNQDGDPIVLQRYLQSDKPIVMDFMYGTCTTICPVLSATFAHFQKGLAGDSSQVLLVSVSIDPDNDTPALMKEYLAKYGGRPGWDILTGKRDDVVSVLKEFDAYVSNKMDHFPLTIMHAPGQDKWVRLYGMLSAADLKSEYSELVAN